jgi:hypothetical protein
LQISAHINRSSAHQPIERASTLAVEDAQGFRRPSKFTTIQIDRFTTDTVARTGQTGA